MCKLHEIQILMSINKILLEHSHTQFSAYGSFHSAAAAELRLTKPKILTE